LPQQAKSKGDKAAFCSTFAERERRARTRDLRRDRPVFDGPKSLTWSGVGARSAHAQVAVQPDPGGRDPGAGGQTPKQMRPARRAMRVPDGRDRRSSAEDLYADRVDDVSSRSKARDSARRSVTAFCSASARVRITARSLRVDDEPAPARARSRSSRTSASSNASIRPFRSNSIWPPNTL
jgi:hypothetical protein